MHRPLDKPAECGTINQMNTDRPICVHCGRDSVEAGMLFGLHAPGIVYICGPCIAAEEKKTGLHGMVFYSHGLKFLTTEQVATLAAKEDSA